MKPSSDDRARCRSGRATAIGAPRRAVSRLELAVDDEVEIQRRRVAQQVAHRPPDQIDPVASSSRRSSSGPAAGSAANRFRSSSGPASVTADHRAWTGERSPPGCRVQSGRCQRPPGEAAAAAGRLPCAACRVPFRGDCCGAGSSRRRSSWWSRAARRRSCCCTRPATSRTPTCSSPSRPRAPLPPPGRSARRAVDNFQWPWYGFDGGRTRFFAAPAKLAPPLHVGWRFVDGALLEFPPVIYHQTHVRARRRLLGPGHQPAQRPRAVAPGDRHAVRGVPGGRRQGRRGADAGAVGDRPHARRGPVRRPVDDDRPHRLVAAGPGGQRVLADHPRQHGLLR